jgi:hypothetical protein
LSIQNKNFKSTRRKSISIVCLFDTGFRILSLDKDFEAIGKLGLASEGGHY